MLTLREALLAARRELEGLEEPLSEAELLLALALGESRLFVRTRLDRELPPEAAARLERFVALRKKRCPYAYIAGRKAFMDYDLEVSPAVLIPRPETELLAERAAALLPRDRETLVCDMGTGSGAVSLGLAGLLPLARICACDISPEALSVARRNADKYGFSRRMEFVETDYFRALDGRRFDAIVSNPPYIPTGETEALMPEVSLYEPRLALDGGPDGLDAYRILFGEGREHLAPGGFVACETGAGQAESVSLIAREGGFAAEVLKDYSGIGRIIIARTENTI